MEKIMTLCAGRHDTQASDAIFDSIDDPMDFRGMRRHVEEVLSPDITDLTVYVTGLTPAMLSVAEVCDDREINLTAMHYDRTTGNYKKQIVIAGYMTCPVCGHRVRGYFCSHCGANQFSGTGFVFENERRTVL